ncbi:CBS domain-containing protein (plasmid) [Streptantibioticus cattleyicolor NRRL 8057 = DSM 46488]|uniref:CBS domain-containing protein n=2 Tax=Streptantibioticus cattleyicolor TaxID=29303 RepID=F8JMA0_STREN|nr:CBS domain-containing protein [Streptantibioticus cattleyicolor NRRL 8057 = DSM 46488]CCB71533.1 Chloride channel protein EriC [Streptantibioticus cattleyicolor NRRL 8057 = DSM 46488]
MALGDFTVRPRMLLITAWALPVGGAGAVAALALLKLIGLVTNLVFYQRVQSSLVAPGPGHPWWLVLGAPVAGGLVIGLMARYGTEKIRGHGMPEAIEAILTGGSRVAPRVAVLKPISAAVSIGTGGPFGAEGPIIMTGGAIGSILAQALRLSADERKTLLVSGAAAGMAATFNSPLAAVLLAVELLLFEWRPRSFVPVVGAVAVSTVCRGFLLGTAPIFPVSTVGMHVTAADSALCVVAGVLGGALAVVATWLVYRAEDAFSRLPFHWMWWPAIGGAVIGVGGLIEPRALGVGYDVIDQLLTGRATVSLIVGILVVKTLIWGLSLGSGTSGGVLAPVFMIGGAVGAAEGLLFPHVLPGFWAMMGLAAVVGGVMRSPLTGVVFTLELTHAWPAALPLLISSTAAYGLSVLVLRRSVLTEKIARRGLHLTREYSTDPLESFFVAEVMDRRPVVLRRGDSLDSALAATLRTDGGEPEGRRLFPVVPDGAAYPVAVVTRRALLHAAARRDPDGPAPTVADICRPAPVVLRPDDTLRRAAYVFAEHGVTEAPVVGHAPDEHVVGTVALRHLLHARRHDLTEEHHRQRLIMRRTVPRDTPRHEDEHAPADGDRIGS